MLSLPERTKNNKDAVYEQMAAVRTNETETELIEKGNKTSQGYSESPILLF